MLTFFKANSSVRYVDIAILLLRVGMSGLLMTHGYEKLLNYLNGARDFPDPIFLGSHLSFLLAIFAEFFCALAVAVGVWTRPACLILVIHFVVISFIVHGPEPLGDKEHSLMYLIAYSTILLTGSGQYSAENRLLRIFS